MLRLLILTTCLMSGCLRPNVSPPDDEASLADAANAGQGKTEALPTDDSRGPLSPTGPTGTPETKTEPECENGPVGAPTNLSATAIPLDVKEQLGVARKGEVIRQGVPLGRALGVTGTTSLAIAASDGRLVPAEFHVLSRWNGALTDVSKPIKWLLVIFSADVAANTTSTYYLTFDQTAPAPAHPLTTVLSGNAVEIHTGLASFRIEGSGLFASIKAWDGSSIVTSASQTAQVDTTTLSDTIVRSVRVERSGPLSATVVVTGAYSDKVGFMRRYELSACSKTARVRQSIAWLDAGSVILDDWRVELVPSFAPPYVATVQSALTQPTRQTTLAAGDTLALRQKQRADRTQPAAFDITGPLLSASGSEATHGMLSVAASSGAVTVALDKMHRYEPQALRVLANGHIALDLADDHVWLAHHQGTFATYAVHASVVPSSVEALNREVAAPLNAPLSAWPRVQTFAAAGIALLSNSTSARATAYDALMRQTLSTTSELVTQKGIAGLMTFGFYPRLWGNAVDGDEIDCDDGTPGNWDNVFWCTTWADYHNASMNAVTFAMRSGETKWIEEIARPAALRTLHTSIYQCTPSDSWFYCGGAPAGYQGYRSDDNSSHQYFETLFHYYWFSGDSTVLTPLMVGASNIRNFYCASRPASACGADVPESDEWANLVGRVPSQWNAVFAFLGQATDASFLDDWRGNTARAFTQRYVEGQDSGGRTLGFLGQVIDGAGQYSTDQLWMATLYDFENLHRLGLETEDALLPANPPLQPSLVSNAWARTLTYQGPALLWPNAMFFTFTGNRIGGNITSVTANLGGSDPFLYTAGKADLAAELARAALRTGDTTMRTLAAEFVDAALAEASAGQRPLGKIQALYLARLHTAVALLENP